MIKKTEVADPEIAFKVKVDRTKITQKFSQVSFYLTMTEKRPDGDRTFKSDMHIGRTQGDHNPIREEIVNDEFDLIFPFVDPHYADGQTFEYALEVVFYGMNLDNRKEPIVFHKETIKGTEKIVADGRHLNYWVENDELKYEHVKIKFKQPEDNTLRVFDAVIGKNGLGVRIDWGKNLRVQAKQIRLIATFENGKAHISTWLNNGFKYTPRYLPLTIFVPYPKGVDHTNITSLPPSAFSVELFQAPAKHISVTPIHRDSEVPWGMSDKSPVNLKLGWHEVEISDKELSDTFPLDWQTRYNQHDSVKLAAFNRWAHKNGYKFCIPMVAKATNGKWKALAHKQRQEVVWSNLDISPMAYKLNKWPAEDPERLVTALADEVKKKNANVAVWPSWEVGTKNERVVLGAFEFPLNLPDSTVSLANQIALNPADGILNNIAKVMEEARRQGYQGGIVGAYSRSTSQKIVAFT